MQGCIIFPFFIFSLCNTLNTQFAAIFSSSIRFNMSLSNELALRSSCMLSDCIQNCYFRYLVIWLSDKQNSQCKKKRLLILSQCFNTLFQYSSPLNQYLFSLNRKLLEVQYQLNWVDMLVCSPLISLYRNCQCLEMFCEEKSEEHCVLYSKQFSSQMILQISDPLYPVYPYTLAWMSKYYPLSFSRSQTCHIPSPRSLPHRSKFSFFRTTLSSQHCGIWSRRHRHTEQPSFLQMFFVCFRGHSLYKFNRINRKYFVCINCDSIQDDLELNSIKGSWGIPLKYHTFNAQNNTNVVNAPFIIIKHIYNTYKYYMVNSTYRHTKIQMQKSKNQEASVLLLLFFSSSSLHTNSAPIILFMIPCKCTPSFPFYTNQSNLCSCTPMVLLNKSFFFQD